MNALLFFLLAGIASAETLNHQLRQIAGTADRAELRWRPELNVQLAGITPLKKTYKGKDIEALLSQLIFVDDLPKKEKPPPPPGTISLPLGNCGCTGSHVLSFWKNDRPVSEVSFHHGTHLRSEKLNGGSDAYLAEAALTWLQREADWVADLKKIESFEQKKTPTQQPKPTDPSALGSS